MNSTMMWSWFVNYVCEIDGPAIRPEPLPDEHSLHIAAIYARIAKEMK
jgi:hypothetical protein